MYMDDCLWTVESPEKVSVIAMMLLNVRGPVESCECEQTVHKKRLMNKAGQRSGSCYVTIDLACKALREDTCSACGSGMSVADPATGYRMPAAGACEQQTLQSGTYCRAPRAALPPQQSSGQNFITVFTVSSKCMKTYTE